jgi:tetratricopeptide (TPR) repeat protein/photosystem II stability/assembly factor-like uncharacterized protein
LDHIVNPYIAGAPVTETSMFFGRDDVFDWIKRSLTGQFIDHILVVHGQRRVGKTSVLKQLQHRLPERYIPVFFDLQGRTHTTLDRFLWWLAREIERVLLQDRGIAISRPEREAFIDDPDFLETQFLPQLHDHIPDCNLLLTFDEFDTLEEEAVKEELARPLIDHLRRLMGKEGLNFIFSIGSSGRKLENMQASYTEFFKAALYKKISFLEKEDAFTLITRPVEGVLEYDRGAVKRIYEVASGHPYFTQLVCHELFSHCQKTSQRKVEKADVEAVLDDVVERGTVNLKFVWDEASDLEKWSLAALAHMEKDYSAKDLDGFLQKQRVRFNQQELQLALLHLREKDVLTDENRFVIYLLQRWLQKNRPMERVREELTELNPIANRYIEIGLEFQSSGLYEKAIESYQEALAVDPGNLQAQVNIAAVYLQQENYVSAVEEYQKALAVDDEDVAARAGLCEAHLALGDLSLDRGRIKEAIRSFEEVLAINAEHTEARQRMADIQRGRAEQAVAEKKYDEAIAAYKEALKYTPEDDSLETQYQAILGEQRTAIISGLMTKVERARSAKRWDEGITIVKEALGTYPNDERLERELKDLLEAQKKSRLDALFTKAEQATKAGRWEDAIRAFEEVLTIAPGDLQTQERLTRAKGSYRQSQLQAHREQARSYTAAERWDEALASWKAYLEMEPEDRTATMEEMKQTELGKERWQSYEEARQAFAKKDYERAIRLLKGIVIEDETYKDASRLMAEAIELRRTARPFWKSKWLWGGIGGVAIVAAGFGLYQSGIFNPPSQVEATGTTSSVVAVEPTSILTLTPSSTPTEMPTATLTPVPVVWSRLSSGREFSRDNITTMAVDPSDPGVIYAGTENAGIYKSINGGISWQPVHNGLGRAWIHSIVIDPEDPRTVYAGVSTGGVYKTIDGGENWFPMNEGINDFGWEGAASLALDPKDSQHLLFTAASSELYETTDGGEKWMKILEGYPSECFLHLKFHPTNPETVFAILDFNPDETSCPGGIFKSEDNGRTWQEMGLSGTEVHNLMHQPLAIDRQNGNYLYVAAMDGLYGSQDGGSTWQSLPISCTSIEVSPDDGKVVYCGGDRIFISNDGGDTWNRERNVSSIGGIAAIAASPQNSQVLFIGGQGVLASNDGGETWEERSSGLGGGRIELTLDPSNNSILYLEQMGPVSLYRSIDSGQNWTLLIEGGFGHALDSAGNILYSMLEEGLLKSADQGLSWEVVPWPMDVGLTSIAAHSKQPQWVYVTYGRGNPPYIYLSKDAGNSWEGTQGMESICDGRLYFDHEDGNVVYIFGDMDAFRSEDSGLTWQRCGSAASWYSRSYSRLVVDPRDSDHLILATRGEGVSLSEDGCRSWQSSNNGLGSMFLNTVAYDPNDPDILYAGGDSGAYVSFNGGESWGEINDGLLGATIIYSIVVDPESNVYAATPYGVFKLGVK